MPRARFRIKSAQGGFSPVEVLLAATVFAFLVTAIIGALVYGRSSAATSGDRGRAVALAEEGLEAVRNIRDAAFSNLSNGTFGLAKSGGIWTFSGTSDTTGIFTRSVAISSADSVRKNVTVTVSWNNGSVSRQTTAVTYLTDWMASIIPPITNGPIMMAYSKTTSTPYYRTWDGSAWSAEGSASAVSGNINYVVLKSSATRNEAVLGTQTSTGAIHFQTWNGTSWSSATQVGTGSTSTRSFDIAYEKDSGRAIIVYTPNSTTADFAYRIWDGSSLSSATNVTTPPTTGAVRWIETRQDPVGTTNEIAMFMSDANNDVYGMRWTGSAWSNMGTSATWDATASTGAKKGIDIEYEQNSGDILFVWADQNTDAIMYRTWNGSSLGSVTTLSVANMNGAGEWVQLAARPASDEIMFGVQDAAADFNTRKWTGSAWDAAGTHPEHDASLENINSRNFDIVWETHSSNPGAAWILWGDGSTVSSRRWSGTSWGTVVNLTGSQDTSFIRLRADPVSGTVFTGNYMNAGSGTANQDISSRELTSGGSTWSTKNIIWGGPTTTDPVHFRIDITTP